MSHICAMAYDVEAFAHTIFIQCGFLSSKESNNIFFQNNASSIVSEAWDSDLAKFLYFGNGLCHIQKKYKTEII